MSIFLRDKVQGQNGRFVLPVGGPVPYGSQVPGSIKLVDQDIHGFKRFFALIAPRRIGFYYMVEAFYRTLSPGHYLL